MNFNLSGEVVLVSGGTGGLGRAVTLAFLAEGAKVVVTYRNPSELDALKMEAGNHAASLYAVAVDITDQSAVSALIDGISARHQRLDTVVNCIGGYAGGLKLWETELSVFERMLQLNLRSGFLLARKAMPLMIEQGSGAFINIAAKAAFDHAAGASAYAASKAASVAMLDSLAADAKGTGVRVNSILPSIIDTPANRLAMPGAQFNKWPKPEEIARVILFLASSEGRIIRGASVPVYGDT